MAKTPFPIAPPVEPMLAKLVTNLPAGDYLYEPKWDGFRAIVFRQHGTAHIQSRDTKSLDRYFPELVDAFLRLLPEGCVLDGEVVVAGAKGLDFDACSNAFILPHRASNAWRAKHRPPSWPSTF